MIQWRESCSQVRVYECVCMYVCLTQGLRKNGKGCVCVVERCGMTAVAIPRIGLIYTFKHWSSLPNWNASQLIVHLHALMQVKEKEREKECIDHIASLLTAVPYFVIYYYKQACKVHELLRGLSLWQERGSLSFDLWNIEFVCVWVDTFSLLRELCMMTLGVADYWRRL